MRTHLMILAALFVSGAALATGDIVLGNGNATLTYTPGGGANMVIAWPPPYTPPAAWTPMWAICMGLTNRAAYTDSGLYVQKGWQVNMLANVRSNPASTIMLMGNSAAANWQVRFGLSLQKWQVYYGGSGYAGSTTPVSSPTWYFIQFVSTNANSCLYTNGAVAASASSGSGSTNTLYTFHIGCPNGSASGTPWDVARAQFIDPNGVLKLDLIATPYGYFTNVLDGVVYSYGVNGQGGTSLDSTNVLGLTIPAQTWK